MGSEPSQPKRKRCRPPKACDSCRKRKVRCNQQIPCDQCVRLKIGNCSYDPQTLLKRAAKTRAGSSGPTGTRNVPLTPVSATDQEETVQRNSLRNLTTSSSLSHSPSTALSNHVDDANPFYHDTAELLENQAFHVAHHSARGVQSPAESSVAPGAKLNGLITKTRLLGRSHWMNIAQEFPFCQQIRSRIQDDGRQNIRLGLTKCKTLGRSIKSQIQMGFQTPLKIQDHIPSKQLADTLVENYFQAFESCYRILHRPSFQREYDQHWTSPDNTTPNFVMKLLLVLAVGTCMNQDQPVYQLHTMALQWISIVQTWLGSPFNEKAKVSVSGIQIYCLFLLARETCSVSPDLLWISAGSLLRTAMLGGLHRDSAQFLCLTPFQTEIRRRLWATVMEICLQASMNAGGAPLIAVDMHDCQPPANLDDEDLNQDTGAVAAAKQASIFTGTSLQIALVQSFPLRLRIAEMLNDFRREQTFPETLQIDAKFSTLLHQLSQRLRLARSRLVHVQSDADMKMYEHMTYRFLVGLHHTFATNAMTDPRLYYSRKVCLDTCLLLAQSAFPSYPPASNTSDFQKIFDISSGTLKNTMMVSFLMLGLELVTQLEDAQSVATHASDNLIRNEIFRILDEYNKYTLRRIQNGETNVKGYVFSSIGIAHMRAMAEGQDSKPAGISAGTRALELVTDILERRYHDGTMPKALLHEHAFNDKYGPPLIEDFGWDDWDAAFDLDFATPDFTSLPA